MIFVAYFDQNLVAMATSLRLLQSEIGQSLKPYHSTKNFVNGLYTSKVVNLKVRDQFIITGTGNFRYFCNKYGKLLTVLI